MADSGYEMQAISFSCNSLVVTVKDFNSGKIKKFRLSAQSLWEEKPVKGMGLTGPTIDEFVF